MQRSRAIKQQMLHLRGHRGIKFKAQNESQRVKTFRVKSAAAWTKPLLSLEGPRTPFDPIAFPVFAPLPAFHSSWSTRIDYRDDAILKSLWGFGECNRGGIVLPLLFMWLV